MRATSVNKKISTDRMPNQRAQSTTAESALIFAFQGRMRHHDACVVPGRTSKQTQRSGLRGARRGRGLRLRFLSFFRCLGRRLLEALGIRLQICVGGGLDGVRFIRAGTRSSAKSARQQNYSEDCFHRKRITAVFVGQPLPYIAVRERATTKRLTRRTNLRAARPLHFCPTEFQSAYQCR